MSRLLALVVAACVVAVRHRDPLGLWDVWDGRWYVGIATHGYGWTFHGKPALAFFPLYPLTVHGGWLLGLPAIAAGLLAANLFALGALFYVHELVRPEWGRANADRTVWLLALLPTAFFLAAPYSESLLVLCAAAALVHARRGNVLVSGLWVAAAVVTRPTGIILLPAVLIAAGGTRPRRWLFLIGPSVLAVAGYLAYLEWQSIPLDSLLHAQRAWHRSLTWPWTGFTTSARWLVNHAAENWPWAVENLLGIAVTVGGLILTARALPDVTPPVALYCIGFWAIVLCTPEWQDGYYAPFSSMDRFVLALFPLLPWIVARLGQRRFIESVVACGVLFAGCTAVHLAGGWVG